MWASSVPQSRLMRLELRVSPLTFEKRAKHWGFFLAKNSTWKRCGSVPTAPSGTFWVERSSGNRFCAKIYQDWCPAGNRPSSLADTLSAIRHCWPIVVFQSRYLCNGKFLFSVQSNRSGGSAESQRCFIDHSREWWRDDQFACLQVWQMWRSDNGHVQHGRGVLFYWFSIVWKFPDICLFIMWNFYCNVACYSSLSFFHHKQAYMLFTIFY